jgi:uncharacterized membrane protein
MIAAEVRRTDLLASLLQAMVANCLWLQHKQCRVIHNHPPLETYLIFVAAFSVEMSQDIINTEVYILVLKPFYFPLRE